jgi:hypothetical protein
MWLACGAVFVAASSGAVAGAAARPAHWWGDPADDRLPYVTAWATADHHFCVGMSWDEQPPDAPFSGSSTCVDVSSEVSLTDGKPTFVPLGFSGWSPTGSRFGGRMAEMFGFVRGASRITAEWDGRPVAVQSVPIGGSGDPVISVLVLKTSSGARAQHSYRVVAYDASGAEIGRAVGPA